MVTFPDQETRLSKIEKHVPKSSNVRIVSDGWASYNSLSSRGYTHSVVVHKEEFVNSEEYHTNSVESVWSQLIEELDMQYERNSTPEGN